MYTDLYLSLSVQQIYTIVLEIRANCAGIDTRFTFFQEPVKVEDVLGRVFPFASECSVESLHAEIKARFRAGPGKRKVEIGHYEIFSATDSEHVLTMSETSMLLPGMSLVMAVILEGPLYFGDSLDSGGRCPATNCLSTDIVKSPAGGNRW